MENIVVSLPDEVYSHFRELAETTEQSLENVLLDHLKTALPALPVDEAAELAALKHLSDDALWTIAREQMSDAAQSRIQQLMDQNSLGKITPAEREELDSLVQRSNRVMMRKAEAAVLLRQRGYTFSQSDFKSANKTIVKNAE